MSGRALPPKRTVVRTDSEEKKHIKKIFQEYDQEARATALSANILNSVTQTSLGGKNKFLFELIQNADDAEIKGKDVVSTAITIEFIWKGSYLIVRHDGKHFDTEDVEKITSCASLLHLDKHQDSTKTGYKDLGFKSLFNISDDIAIFSNKYHFRFSKERWKNPQARPWQVIPIWTEKEDLPTEVRQYINDQSVNFVIRLNKQVSLSEEFDFIKNHPESMLFLRRVKKINLVIEQEEWLIRKAEAGMTNSPFSFRKFTVAKKNANDWVVHGTTEWIISDFEFDISPSIQSQLKELNDFICPQRLKQATKTMMRFAGRFDGGVLKENKNSPLFATLPTGEITGLPFIVNGEFILSQDRTELLDNVWNKFLLNQLGYYQFHWLKQFAEYPDTVHYVLNVFGSKNIKTKNQNYTQLQQAYTEGFQKGAKEIAWIPAFDKKIGLLKVNQCIIDDTGFFERFEVEDEITTKLVSYELKNPEKLHNGQFAQQFSLLSLFARVGSYLLNSESDFNYNLLIFLQYKIGVNYKYTEEFKKTPCLLTQRGAVVSPFEAYISTSDDTDIPEILKIDPIKIEVITENGKLNKNLYLWLKKLGALDAVRIQIIRNTIFNWIFDDKITLNNDIVIVRYLFIAFQNNDFLVEDYKILSKLKLRTKANSLRMAKDCYLADSYRPTMKLEKVIQDSSLYLSFDYCEDPKQVEQLKQFFLKMGVKGKIAVNFISSYRRGEAIAEKGQVMSDYFAYLKKMHNCPSKAKKNLDNHSLKNFVDIDLIFHLTNQAYASFFWKLVLQDWDQIKKYGEEAKYDSGVKKEITPFLYYYMNAYKCIRGLDGKFYYAHDVYPPYLQEIVGDILPVAAIKEELTFEQADFFGFKAGITLDDSLKIFKYLKQKPEKAKPKVYATIISDLLKLSLPDREKLKKHNKEIYLLATDNKLRLASDLTYFESEQYKIPNDSASFIKQLPGFNHKEMIEVCGLFGMTLISAQEEDLKIEGAIEEKSLQEFMYKQLPMIALLEANTLNEDAQQILVNFQIGLERLTCYSVKTLVINNDLYTSNDLLYYRKDDEIYYVGRWNKSSLKHQILAEVKTYLDIQSDIQEVLKLKEEQQINDWLKRYHFSSKTYQELKLLSKTKPVLSNEEFENWEDNDFDEFSKEEEELETAMADLGLNDSNDQAVVKTPESSSDRMMKMIHAMVEEKKHSPAKMQMVTPVLQKPLPPTPTQKLKSNFAPAALAVKKVGFFRVQPATPKPKTQSTSLQNKLSVYSPPRQDLVINKISEEEKLEVGRWSEELVYLFLLEHYETICDAEAYETNQGFFIKGMHVKKKKEMTIEVMWMNKQNEQGRPFDFKIMKNNSEYLIEVKGTSTNDKYNFEISANEVELMKTQGVSYRIYRVFNAGKAENVRIEKLKDPVKEISLGNITLTPEVYNMQYNLKK